MTVADPQATGGGAMPFAAPEFADLLRHMQNGVAYCRMLVDDGGPDDFVFLYTNPAYHAQTGMRPACGMRASEAMPGIRTVNPEILAAGARVAAGGAPERFETVLPHQGHRFAVQMYCPKPAHFVAVFEAISDWRQEEADLRLANERLALAQRAAKAGVWDWDLATGRIYWSRELFELFGLDQRSAQASLATWRNCLHPEDRQALDVPSGELTPGQAMLVNEYRIVRPSGEEVWVGTLGDATCDAAGKPLRLTGICLDITARKKTELEIDDYRARLEERVEQQTAEISAANSKLTRALRTAEAANRAKSAFLAKVGYQIRTPLSGIMGMAYLMRRDEITPAQAERLDKIQASGQELLGIINDVFEMAKIEAGKVEIAAKEFTLPDLLRSVTDAVGDDVRAKGLSLHIDTAGVPRTMDGDPARLAEALVTYVGNAIRFTDQGSVTIRGRLIEETDADYLLRFDVIDTGVGIPEEKRRVLFAPLTATGEAAKRPLADKGLGLAITKRIVRLMGGEVGVESAPGKGSTFWLTVRLGKGLAAGSTDDANGAESAESRLRRAHAGARILLAEDDPINQEVMLEVLFGVGLAPELAVNGREALRMAERNEYAIILMDVQMPEMDGLAATRAIRLLPGRVATPILAVTANVFADVRHNCLEAGMNDFVAKPVNPIHLFNTLLKWLERH